MDESKVIAVAIAIEQELLLKGYRPVRADHTRRYHSHARWLNHACWLAVNIPKILNDEAEESDPAKRKERRCGGWGVFRGS